MCNITEFFSNLEDSSDKKSVSLWNRKQATLSGIGLIKGKVFFDSSEVPMQLKEILFIPNLVCVTSFPPPKAVEKD